MNLIEAIKSKRPFRRPGWVSWLSIAESGDFFVWANGQDAKHDFRPSWFAYDDWEIQEPSVTITASQLINAVKQTAGWLELYPLTQRTTASGESDVTWVSFAQEVAKELGLEAKP